MEPGTPDTSLVGHDEVEVPAWSGMFIRLGESHSRVGVLLIYAGDHQMHTAPPDWYLAGEPSYVGTLDAEMWLCRKR